MVCNYFEIFLEQFVDPLFAQFLTSYFDCANKQVCVIVMVLVRCTRYVINWDGNRNGFCSLVMSS